MSEALERVVVGAARRTPIGGLNGALSSLSAHQLAAIAISAAMAECGLDGARTAVSLPVAAIPERPYGLEIEFIDSLGLGDVVVMDCSRKPAAAWGELFSTASVGSRRTECADRRTYPGRRQDRRPRPLSCLWTRQPSHRQPGQGLHPVDGHPGERLRPHGSSQTISLSPIVMARLLLRTGEHRRYHESPENVTTADAYFGRAQAKIKQRERIKRQTIKHRR